MERRLSLLEANHRHHPRVSARLRRVGPRPLAVRILVCGICVALLSGCGVNGLNFVQDDRIEVTSPGDRASVTLPLTVRWDVADFDVTGPNDEARVDAGYFGVYVDRAPQPPGETQASLVRDETSCRTNPGCPDADYLAQRNIYTTEEQSFVIERLPQPGSEAPRRREFHEVTIVLLNGRGERIGESASVRQFEVDRDAA